MSRHVSFPRKRFRERRLRFLQTNWLRLSIGLLVVVVLGAVETRFMSGYVLGASHTALVLVYVGMILLTFLAHNTGAIGQLAGAWGEDQTRDLLKRARRKHLIWTWVDGVATGSGDIDHFVITRRGGLVAIDSKWRNDVTRHRLETDADSATAAARRANHVLRSMKIPVQVTPLVVVWGSARGTVPDHATVNDVDFVRGEQLLPWLSALTGEEVDRPSATELRQRLLAFRERVRPAGPARSEALSHRPQKWLRQILSRSR